MAKIIKRTESKNSSILQINAYLTDFSNPMAWGKEIWKEAYINESFQLNNYIEEALLSGTNLYHVNNFTYKVRSIQEIQNEEVLLTDEDRQFIKEQQTLNPYELVMDSNARSKAPVISTSDLTRAVTSLFIQFTPPIACRSFNKNLEILNGTNLCKIKLNELSVLLKDFILTKDEKDIKPNGSKVVIVQQGTLARVKLVRFEIELPSSETWKLRKGLPGQLLDKIIRQIHNIGNKWAHNSPDSLLLEIGRVLAFVSAVKVPTNYNINDKRTSNEK